MSYSIIISKYSINSFYSLNSDIFLHHSKFTDSYSEILRLYHPGRWTDTAS